jgi:LuxR family transcriptional regulator, maltose regulon positive regulatory protein
VERSSSQLIQTKFGVPKQRWHVIERRRLIEQVTADPGIILTLVSAPAGYGKSTLLAALSQALAENGTKMAWYALDASDNDPNLFGSYLLASLGAALHIERALAPASRLIQSSAECNIEKILSWIINAVDSTDQKCWLVLDDYHYITAPAVHSALTFLLDHLPKNMQVIMGSRSDPPLPLARLRARGQLAEIRAADLRFTAAEAGRFLNETMHLELAPEAVAEIETRTEGWVTGLQLAALSMTGKSAQSGLVSRFGGSNRYLVEYLLQEVLGQQRPDIQEFLMSTSVLERLCGPLCDALTQRQSGSEAILHQLEQANIFMVPLDGEGYWYRYHHLWRDFLRARLEQSEPERAPQLHRAASEWYNGQHLLREAVTQALETRDWDYAADLVEQHGMTVFRRSEIAILHEWCGHFSEEVFGRHPLLCILQGWALSLTYRQENRPLVEVRLQQAQEAAAAMEDKARGLRINGQAALVRLALCLIPDPATSPEQIIALAERTLELLPGDESGRSLATSATGYAYLALQNGTLARQALEEYRRLSLTGGFYYGVAAASFHLANLAYYEGQLERAAEIGRQEQAHIAAISGNPEPELPAVGSLYIIQGCIRLEENRLDEAERELRRGLELIGWTNNPYTLLIAGIALFRLREIQGRESEAWQYLEDIETTWPDIAFCTRGLKLGQLMQRKPEDPATREQAANWIRQFKLSFGPNRALPGIGPFGGAQAYYLASLIWVQAQIVVGQPAETLYYLERQQKVAEAQGLTLRRIELSLAEAQASQALGDERRAMAALGRALRLAEPAGCLRIFDQGPALRRLLEEAARRGIAREYIARIRQALAATPGPGASPATNSLTSTISSEARSDLEILSERELEVLRLMAGGATNQELADHLVVSVGTIKSHVNHILGKLDVHNRLEAVARARQAGLL